MQSIFKKKFLFYILCTMAFGSCNSPIQNNQPAPNILFAIMDDATWQHMSAYGCKWVNTPAFDYVANNGILFNRAYTPNAKCAPSRSCILTGRNSWQLEEAANHWPMFPIKFKTFPEALAENGYHIGHTAKGWAPGIAKKANGELRDLIGKKYNQSTLIPPTNAISKIDYTSNFKSFLNDKSEEQPFFFWYGSTEPHRFYEYKSGVNKGGKSLADINDVYDFWPDNPQVRHDLLDYALEIEYFDKHLQQMIDELKARGELNNTMIVVTADNGMPFPRIKGQEYELSNHLPLAIMWLDGIENKGRTVDDFISFIDFAPSFLDIAHIKESGMQPITGRSLNTIFNSTSNGQIEPDRNQVLIGKERHDVGRPNDQGYPIRGLFEDDYLYIYNFESDRWPAGDPVTGYLNCDGSPTKTECLVAKKNKSSYKYWLWNFGKRVSQELYNIKTDPECMTNLALADEHQDRLRTMHTVMMDKLKEQEDPRALGNGQLFESFPYMDLKTANFYNRYMAGEELNAGWVNRSDFETKSELESK